MVRFRMGVLAVAGLMGLLAALVPSCGHKNDPSGSAAFCQDYSAAFCDFAIRCGQASASGKSDCLSYFQGSFCGLGASSANKGYQKFDVEKGKACVASITNASCEATTTGALGGCEGLFSAQVDTGGACFESSDCKTSGDGCGGAGCSRTCRKSGVLGAPCSPTDGCVASRCDRTTNVCVALGGAGTECSRSTDCDATAFCDSVADKCVALPTAGQACRSSFPRCGSGTFCSGTVCQPTLAQGAACSGFDACQAGLFCDAAPSPDTCQPRKAAGATCQSGSECQDLLRCTNGFCAAPRTAGQTCTGNFNECAQQLFCDRVLHTCVALTFDLKAGESCTLDYRRCGPALACRGASVNADGGVGTSGTCGVPSIGDVCTARFNDSACPAHAYCLVGADAGTGSCTAAGSGTACQSATHCQSGDYCDGSKCAARHALGASCTSTAQCAVTLSCRGGVCGKLADTGAACTVSDDCLFPNNCAGGVCVHGGALNEGCLNDRICLSGACQLDAGTCGPKLPEGGACNFFSGACESGRCSQGKCAPACM